MMAHRSSRRTLVAASGLWLIAGSCVLGRPASLSPAAFAAETKSIAEHVYKHEVAFYLKIKMKTGQFPPSAGGRVVATVKYTEKVAGKDVTRDWDVDAKNSKYSKDRTVLRLCVTPYDASEPDPKAGGGIGPLALPAAPPKPRFGGMGSGTGTIVVTTTDNSGNPTTTSDEIQVIPVHDDE